MFYREGKSSLKCVLERGLLGKQGAGSPKGNQENGEGFVAVAGGISSSKSLQHRGHWLGGNMHGACAVGIGELVQVILCVWAPEEGSDIAWGC